MEARNPLPEAYLSGSPEDHHIATLLRIAAVSLQERATALAQIRLLAAVPLPIPVLVIIVVVVVVSDRVTLGLALRIGAVVDEAEIAGIGCQRGAEPRAGIRFQLQAMVVHPLGGIHVQHAAEGVGARRARWPLRNDLPLLVEQQLHRPGHYHRPCRRGGGGVGVLYPLGHQLGVGLIGAGLALDVDDLVSDIAAADCLGAERGAGGRRAVRGEVGDLVGGHAGVGRQGGRPGLGGRLDSDLGRGQGGGRFAGLALAGQQVAEASGAHAAEAAPTAAGILHEASSVLLRVRRGGM